MAVPSTVDLRTLDFVVETRGLTKRFGDRVAVDHVQAVVLAYETGLVQRSAA